MQPRPVPEPQHAARPPYAAGRAAAGPVGGGWSPGDHTPRPVSGGPMPWSPRKPAPPETDFDRHPAAFPAAFPPDAAHRQSGHHPDDRDPGDQRFDDPYQNDPYQNDYQDAHHDAHQGRRPDGPESESLPRSATRSPRSAGLVSMLTAWLVTGVLVVGTLIGSEAHAIAVLLAQLALVVVWCLATQPPGAVGVGVVGGLTAVAADGVALWGPQASAGPLIAVVAAAFIATTIAQLARGVARRNVTESYGATLTVAVAVTALASTIALGRQGGADGDQLGAGGALVVATLLAAGAGLAFARLGDLVLPRPTIHQDVPRGVVGLVVAGLAGVGATALAAVLLTDASIGPATLVVGWPVATTAALADLGVDYACAGRVAVEERPRYGLVGAVLGPMIGLSMAAPVGYLLGLVT